MNKTVKNTMVYLVGTVILAVFGFLNTMLLTRVLTPHVYALYGLLTSFGSSAVMLISLGLDASYMRFYYIVDLRKREFFFRCMRLPMIALVIFVILMLEPKRALVNKIFDEQITTWCIVLICIYIFLQVVQRFTQLSARMEEKAGNYVISNIVGKVGYVLLILGLGVVGCQLEFEPIVVAFVVTSFFALVINLPIVLSGKQVFHGNERITQKELFLYGFPTCINSTLVLVIPVVERIIIRDLAGWEVLSVYTAAAIFQTVVGIVTTMVDNIWSPVVYRKYEDEDAFKPLMHYFGLGVTVMLMVGLAFVVLLRRWLVLILDKNYFDVMIIAPAVFFASCLLPITSILGVGVNIKKKTIHYIISPLLQLVVSVILCYALVPAYGLLGIGIAVLISSFISRFYRIAVGLKYYSTDRKEVKCMALMLVGMFFSAYSMVNTNLAFDVAAFVSILVIATVIVNKEAVSLFGFAKKMFKRNV